MTMPIGKTLKGLSLAAILLAVPAFAVFGLMANASHRSSSVEISAEHDPLRTGFRFTQPKSARSGDQTAFDKSIQENDLRNWEFTEKPVPSPTPIGYTYP